MTVPGPVSSLVVSGQRASRARPPKEPESLLRREQGSFLRPIRPLVAAEATPHRSWVILTAVPVKGCGEQGHLLIRFYCILF